MLESAVDAGVHRFIHIGSCSEFLHGRGRETGNPDRSARRWFPGSPRTEFWMYRRRTVTVWDIVRLFRRKPYTLPGVYALIRKPPALCTPGCNFTLWVARANEENTEMESPNLPLRGSEYHVRGTSERHRPQLPIRLRMP